MSKLLIKDATLINENRIITVSVLIQDQYIEDIFTQNIPHAVLSSSRVIDAKGKFLIPGIIDDQVHFREPGLTYKADIASESRAAVAGGITSFMDMPNVKPSTTTHALLEDKFSIAAQKSLANFSFYLGATNTNFDEVLACDPKRVCGIKIFMGSSTGNMLVDKRKILEKIFSKSNMLIAVHCEDDQTVSKNLQAFKKIYSDHIPIHLHPKIRSEQACFRSSAFAVNLAQKYDTRLHILHLSTAKELELLQAGKIEDKLITAEVCVHHLFFDDKDYKKLGVKIKWNPAVKKKSDKEALLKAVINDKVDVIATDHAPHTWEEKQNIYTLAPSGGPLVQHSLNVMLELYREGKISLEKIVEKMCHAPARLFRIKKRGFIRKGFYADLCLFEKSAWNVDKNNILYKCNWSPFEGYKFNYKVCNTFVNGHLVYDNGNFDESKKGKALEFTPNT